MHGQTRQRRYPAEANVIDTLGWIYYKRNEPGFAIPLLVEAVEKDGNDPVKQYHLGMAFMQNKEWDKARDYLQRALKAKPDFAGAADARTALATLTHQWPGEPWSRLASLSAGMLLVHCGIDVRGRPPAPPILKLQLFRPPWRRQIRGLTHPDRPLVGAQTTRAPCSHRDHSMGPQTCAASAT
jgi:tetratricopeptide (TPR) repeat protein